MSACARFTLTQHDHYTGEAGQFKLLWVEHLAANNLPAQVSQLLQRLGGLREAPVQMQNQSLAE
jgi:hypothetical protein